MRFRLDPSQADAPVAPPPVARPPPDAPRAPPAPSSPGRAAGPTGWTRQRLIVVAVLGLVVLAGGTGAVLYATDSGPFAYPNRYLVAPEDAPAGLTVGPVPAPMRAELGMKENPGQVPPERIEEINANGPRPEEVWAESLSLRGTHAVLVLAMQYADEEDARSAAQSAGPACLRGGFAVLRDGDVLVLVAAEGAPESLTGYGRVVSLIESQAGVKRTCG